MLNPLLAKAIGPIVTALLLAGAKADAGPVYQSFWVAANRAPIFDRPNGVADGEYKWGMEIQAPTRKLKSSPQDWVPLLKYGQDPNLDGSYLWVRRNDLWDGKPKRVIGCWPIKRIVYTMGDYTIEINFGPDGGGVVKEYTDHPGMGIKYYKTHAYMSQNIVQFHAMNEDRRHFFTAGYKPEDRYLYPGGSRDWTEQTLFDKDKLRDCTNQPQVIK